MCEAVSPHHQSATDYFVIKGNREETREDLKKVFAKGSVDGVRLLFSKAPSISAIAELSDTFQALENSYETRKQEEKEQLEVKKEEIKKGVEASKTVHSQKASYQFFEAFWNFNEQYPDN